MSTSTTSSIETVAEEMKAGLALLEELHVLSQTQTLLLESGDLAQLGSIVDAKEALVARITNGERRLALLLVETGPRGPWPQELLTLKEQALNLIERVSDVERTNRQHLEKLRADLIQRSQLLRQDRKIQETYGQLS